MKTFRRGLILASLVLAFASTLNGFQSGEWLKVAPVGAGFSVMMPAKPEEEIRPGDDLTIHLFGLSTENALYIVAYGDYAPSVRVKIDDELAANRDKFLQGLEARLIESKQIKFEGREGLEFTGESDQASFRSRLFIFGTRVHQVAVAVLRGKDDTANANRFFESFHFSGAEPREKP